MVNFIIFFLLDDMLLDPAVCIGNSFNPIER
jgi:hypothetical protein